MAGKDFERVRAMYALYETGVSLDEVGERFGVSAVRVSQLFRAERLPARRGPSPQTRARLDAKRLERVREMYAVYDTGVTYAEVGERFGISEERVCQLFSWAGLPSRRARGAVLGSGSGPRSPSG
jgi:DNA-directed RNA polymerase sigma subunit (sigma70/sigma32)